MDRLMQKVGKFATYGMIIATLCCQTSTGQTAQKNTESIVSKTIAARHGGTLQVDSIYASQQIGGDDQGQVHISVAREVLEEFKVDEERILSEHKVIVSQPSEGITVYSGVDEAAAQRWNSAYYIVRGIRLSVLPLRVSVKILVPKNDYNVRAATKFGSQTITNIGGTVKAEARRRIRIEHIRGKEVVAKSSFGGVEVLGAAGSVNARGREAIVIRGVRENVAAKSSFSEAVISDIGGSVKAEARSRLKIERIRGKEVVAKSSFGGVEVFDAAGTVHAVARRDIMLKKVGKILIAKSFVREGLQIGYAASARKNNLFRAIAI